jgi:hypothetical protein
VNRKLSLPLLIVCAAMLFGAFLRMHHLGDRTMSHVEMFVPNIPLAEGLSIPKPRMDLWTVVTNTLSSDTHPPGFYLFMWFVTKIFGTSTLAIRLPSVLFGVASIGLVFWLAILIEQPIAGCVAAAFLAFNGYHIVWSQTARMYSMLCFLGLLTTILLLLVARSAVTRKGLEISYAALTLLGLATHDFFWLLLATQMLWVLGNAWMQNRPLPNVLHTQLLVVILGSPLLAFAVYQSGNPVASLSRDAPKVAREYVQFEYLIPGWDDTWAPRGAPAAALAPQFVVPMAMFAILCFLLLIVGIARLRPEAEPLLSQKAKPFTGAWLVAAVLGVLAIVLHVIVAIRHGDTKSTLKVTEALIPLPLVLVSLALLLRGSWDRLRSLGSRLNLKFLQGGPPLVWMQAIVPVLLLAGLSFVFRPLMDQRGFLFMAPYLLLTLAAGVVALGRRSRWLALSLFVILGTLHGFSVWAYSDRTVSPLNFKEFAEALKPHLHDNDLIFMRQGWDTSPILYYLTPARHHLYASHFTEESARHPDARIWVLLFHEEKILPAIAPVLEDYREVEAVDVYEARAVLYCRGACR